VTPTSPTASAPPRAYSRSNPSTLLAALKSELDTDWVADPWGWGDLAESQLADVLERPMSSTLSSRLHVPFLRGRSRVVPQLDMEWRVRLLAAALRIAAEMDDVLPHGVLPYRPTPGSGFIHYREAACSRRALEASHVHESPLVLRTDVARFFPNARLEHLGRIVEDRGVRISSDERALLSQVEAELGYILPEGYVASRALANVYLIPVDEQIEEPFTRWVDDYVVFGGSRRQLEDVCKRMASSANLIGLELSKSKTEIMSSAKYSRGTLPTSLDPHDPYTEVLPAAQLRAASPVVRERQLRFQLRLSVEHGTADSTLREISQLGSLIPATLAPRLAHALANSSWGEHAAGLFDSHWSRKDSHAEFRRARLASAAWYAPQSFVEERMGQWLLAARKSWVGRDAILRVLAKHSPGEALRAVDESDAPPRSRRLIMAEAAGDRSEPALVAGPPTATYL
jgi:hypothetical protein